MTLSWPGLQCVCHFSLLNYALTLGMLRNSSTSKILFYRNIFRLPERGHCLRNSSAALLDPYSYDTFLHSATSWSFFFSGCMVIIIHTCYVWWQWGADAVVFTVDFIVHGNGLLLCALHVEVVPKCWLMRKLLKAICVCYSFSQCSALSGMFCRLPNYLPTFSYHVGDGMG